MVGNSSYGHSGENDAEYTRVLIREEMAVALKVHDEAIENIVKDNHARTLQHAADPRFDDLRDLINKAGSR